MTTITVDPVHPQPEALAHAAAILRRGGLVAFPTETVYGLGANALDPDAVQRIYEAKGRPSYNPLIVHVVDVAGAQALVRHWPRAADRLAEAFWPGPLTLVLPKRAIVPDVVTAGLDTVAVRAPAHPVARALIAAAALPIAAPSANRFTELSPTLASHVARSLGGRVDLILDGGPTTVGIESTVLDLSTEPATLLRPGLISPAELSAVLGEEVVSAPPPATPKTPRRSPGMLDRHYAPRATLRLFDAETRPAAEAAARDAVSAGATVGALLLSPLAAAVQHVVSMPHDPASYARTLYATLHALDEEGCQLILVERVPRTDRWLGVTDRLERAASGS
jgi:L-threonylcarbamoyladenylate synthase